MAEKTSRFRILFPNAFFQHTAISVCHLTLTLTSVDSALTLTLTISFFAFRGFSFCFLTLINLNFRTSTSSGAFFDLLVSVSSLLSSSSLSFYNKFLHAFAFSSSSSSSSFCSSSTFCDRFSSSTPSRFACCCYLRLYIFTFFFSFWLFGDAERQFLVETSEEITN